MEMCKGFEDTEDAIAYAHQLMTRAQLAGCLNIDGHIPSREERALQIEIRVFVKKLRELIGDCKPKYLYPLLSYHDMLYRVGFHEAPPRKFREDIIARIFEEWEKGDSGISEADLYAIVAPQVRAHNPQLNPRHFSVYYRLRESWCQWLRHHDSFMINVDASSRENGMTYAENYRRLTQLVSDNLSAYFPNDEKECKSRWVAANLIDPNDEYVLFLSNEDEMEYHRFMTKASFLRLLPVGVSVDQTA